MFFGCAPLREGGSVGVRAEVDLSIEPDRSKGKRYDQYSAMVIVGRVVTMAEGSLGVEVIPEGRVVVVGEKIAALLKPGEPFPAQIDSENAVFIKTDGIIFPGLINLHDHPHYNHIPIWDVSGRFTNRYQWQSTDEYRIRVKYLKNIVEQKRYWGLLAEVMKYAEVKHLVAGETAIQGSPGNSRKYCQILLRNLDTSPNFGFLRMRSYVRNVVKVSREKLARWRADMDEGKLDALFLHIAEGTDSVAQREFDFLVENGLARKEVIIIHGVGLSEEQIRFMSYNDMTVVWSPTSNILLYGKTANIPLMVGYGVNLCLGTDWNPTGCKNLLCEMKLAYEYSNFFFDSLLGFQDIVEMVTVNAADAVGWGRYVGRVLPGFYADLLVITDPGGDPFEALVEATEADVELVLVGGDPLYGDSAFMAMLKPGDFEYIRSSCGFTKGIDVTKEGVPLGDETLRQIIDTLRLAMSFDLDAMMEAFSDKALSDYPTFADYIEAKFPGYRPLPLDPLYPCSDEHFFEVLRKRLPFDIGKIYYGRGG